MLGMRSSDTIWRRGMRSGTLGWPVAGRPAGTTWGMDSPPIPKERARFIDSDQTRDSQAGEPGFRTSPFFQIGKSAAHASVDRSVAGQ